MTINQHNNKKHKEYRKIKTKLCNLFFIIFGKKTTSFTLLTKQMKLNKFQHS